MYQSPKLIFHYVNDAGDKQTKKFSVGKLLELSEVLYFNRKPLTTFTKKHIDRQNVRELGHNKNLPDDITYYIDSYLGGNPTKKHKGGKRKKTMRVKKCYGRK